MKVYDKGGRPLIVGSKGEEKKIKINIYSMLISIMFSIVKIIF